MPLKLDYYYGGEAEQYNFYRIPKVLFTDPHYTAISIEAKILYGLMLDRMGLSIKNAWLDSYGRVYIFFTMEDAIAMLNTGHNKAVRLFKELEDIGLIERKKQGQGKPTLIYVKNFIVPPEPGQTSPIDPVLPSETSQNRKSALPDSGQQEFQTSGKGKSKIPESGSQDFPKGECNNTEINNTENNDTDLSIPPFSPPRRSHRRSSAQDDEDRIEKMDTYREIIRENIDYEILLFDHPHDKDLIDGYVELMVETICGNSKSVRVSKQDMPTEAVRNRFLKLDKEHIEYVMDCMRQNTTKIGNIKAYMLSALYNAPVTIGQYFTSLVSHDMAHGCAAG